MESIRGVVHKNKNSARGESVGIQFVTWKEVVPWGDPWGSLFIKIKTAPKLKVLGFR